MEDDLKKNGKRIIQKWKKNQSTKINLIGCDTIVNSPSLQSLCLGSMASSPKTQMVFNIFNSSDLFSDTHQHPPPNTTQPTHITKSLKCRQCFLAGFMISWWRCYVLYCVCSLFSWSCMVNMVEGGKDFAFHLDPVT